MTFPWSLSANVFAERAGKVTRERSKSRQFKRSLHERRELWPRGSLSLTEARSHPTRHLETWNRRLLPWRLWIIQVVESVDYKTVLPLFWPQILALLQKSLVIGSGFCTALNTKACMDKTKHSCIGLGWILSVDLYVVHFSPWKSCIKAIETPAKWSAPLSAVTHLKLVYWQCQQTIQLKFFFPPPELMFCKRQKGLGSFDGGISSVRSCWSRQAFV